MKKRNNDEFIIQKMLLPGMSALALSACNPGGGGEVGESDNAQTNESEAIETTQETSGETTAGGAVPATQLSDVDDQAALEAELAYGDTLSIISYSGCAAPSGVAYHMGFFEEEDLDVDLEGKKSSHSRWNWSFRS